MPGSIIIIRFYVIVGNTKSNKKVITKLTKKLEGFSLTKKTVWKRRKVEKINEKMRVC